MDAEAQLESVRTSLNVIFQKVQKGEPSLQQCLQWNDALLAIKQSLTRVPNTNYTKFAKPPVFEEIQFLESQIQRKLQVLLPVKPSNVNVDRSCVNQILIPVPVYQNNVKTSEVKMNYNVVPECSNGVGWNPVVNAASVYSNNLKSCEIKSNSSLTCDLNNLTGASGAVPKQGIVNYNILFDEADVNVAMIKNNSSPQTKQVNIPTSTLTNISVTVNTKSTNKEHHNKKNNNSAIKADENKFESIRKIQHEVRAMRNQLSPTMTVADAHRTLARLNDFENKLNSVNGDQRDSSLKGTVLKEIRDLKDIIKLMVRL